MKRYYDGTQDRRNRNDSVSPLERSADRDFQGHALALKVTHNNPFYIIVANCSPMVVGISDAVQYFDGVTVIAQGDPAVFNIIRKNLFQREAPHLYESARNGEIFTQEMVNELLSLTRKKKQYDASA